MAVDAYARTESGNGAAPPNCEAGTRAWSALQGDQQTPGVFEQLRKLNAMMESGLTLMRVSSIGIWVIAAAIALQVWRSTQ